MIQEIKWPKHFLNYTIFKAYSLGQNKNVLNILPLYLGGGNDLFQTTAESNFVFNFENFFLQLLENEIIVITEMYKILVLFNYYFISVRQLIMFLKLFDM